MTDIEITARVRDEGREGFSIKFDFNFCNLLLLMFVSYWFVSMQVRSCLLYENK